MSEMVESGPERGRALRRLMDSADLSISGLAATGVAKGPTISAWINGGRTNAGYDIIRAKPETGHALLGVIAARAKKTPEDVAAELGLPDEIRSQWLEAAPEVPPQQPRPRGPRSVITPREPDGLGWDSSVARIEGYVEGSVITAARVWVEYAPGDTSGLAVASGPRGRLRVDHPDDIPASWHVLGRWLGMGPA